MKVGIDARLYGREGRGLGRYISELLLHLEKVDQKNSYAVLLGRWNEEEYRPQSERFEKVVTDVRWYGVREHWEIPKIFARAKCDLVHIPHFNVPWFLHQPFIATIHDLILWDFFPRRASRHTVPLFALKYALYRRVLQRGIQRASHIFTPSEYVKESLVYHFPRIDRNSITVTPEGTREKNAIQKYMGVGYPYILVVGSAYPHKNLEALCDAFRMVREKGGKDIELRIVGRKDYFITRLEKEKRGEGIRFFGEVSDETLMSLYAGALTLIFPSLEEGFGLPGIEALAHGTPVIAGDRASLPEVYRTHAYYVNPYDVQDIFRVLKEVVDKLKNREEKGSVKKFDSGKNWLGLAKKTVDIYNL